MTSRTIPISLETIVALYRIGGISPGVLLYLLPFPYLQKHCPEIITPEVAKSMCRVMKLLEQGGEKSDYIY